MTDIAKINSVKRSWTSAGQEVSAIHEQGKAANKDPKKVIIFKGMIRALEKYYSIFESAWNELHDLHEGQTDLIFPSLENKALFNSIRNCYFETYAYHEAILAREQAEKDASVNPKPSHSSLGDSSNLFNSSNNSCLQPIPLPKFSGQILDWPAFRDTFCSLIHDDDRIPPIKKLHYLLRSLTGPASTIASSFKLEGNNYELVWKALLNSFENKRLLASTYLNKLIDFKPLQKSNFESLQHFLSEISDSVSAFKKLSIDRESNFILFHLAIRNLDPRTREQFEIANKGTEFPVIEDLSKFIRERVLALQLSKGITEQQPDVKHLDKLHNHKFTSKKSVALMTVGNKTREVTQCYVCNSSSVHNLAHCYKFKQANVDQRLQWIKNWNGCHNCLSAFHRTNSCTSTFHCHYCPHRHHSLLHKNSAGLSSTPINVGNSANPNDTSLVAVRDASLNSVTTTSSPKVLLGTASAEIRDARGIFHRIRLVIDNGSTQSFITKRMADRLGLIQTKFNGIISGIGDSPFSSAIGKVKCSIRPLTGNSSPLKTTAVVVKNITSHLPNVDLPLEIHRKYLKFQLADPQFFKSSPVDLLLGAELFLDILTGRVQDVEEGLPKLVSTIFGDVVIGSIPSNPQNDKFTTLFTSVTLDDLHEGLKRFWEVEEPEVFVSKDPEDIICEEHFVSTHHRTPEGQYVVRLPFKRESLPDLSSSAITSRKIFLNLESKLLKNPQLRSEYTKFMEEYITLGHMTPTESHSSYVIPHHPVFKDDRNKTKLRVVFNGSHATDAGSLNDYLMIGPKLQNNISLVLLNYRVHKVVFTADVVKMFRGILVDSSDRNYQHIFWRSDPSHPLLSYELNTVTYGLRSSPYQSIRVLHQIKADEGHNFPLAAKILTDDVYIDDYLTGSHSVEAALELQAQLIGILGKAGLTLSKWASNSKELLRKVKSKSEEPLDINIDTQVEPKIKLLGLQWDPSSDCFSFVINPPGPISTKRAILSAVSKVYDPLGFVTPSILLMKNFIQDIWKEGLHWDAKLSSSMQAEWDLLITELPLLARARIPRFVGTVGEASKVQVIGFCDASTRGYCAVLYLRTICEDSINVHFLIAKSKLAPVRTISVPRLELQAAVLLGILYKSILPFLSRLSSVQIPPIFHTDSSIVLGWISTPPYQLKTFVANRVTQIIENTPIDSWNHINSTDNPSDCGSRGILPSDLIKHPLWWTGPSWLKEDEENWPKSIVDHPKTLPDVKQIVTTLLTSHQSSENFITWMEKFSSFQKLLRVVAVLVRSQTKRNQIIPRAKPLDVEDVRRASVCCVRSLQNYYFIQGATNGQQKMNKLFGNLSPFLDKDGVWRVGGRLRHSDLPEFQKHPILLPSQSHFVMILVNYYHNIFLHASPSIIQAMLQIRYWIPNLRYIVRKCSTKCLKCFKQNSKIFPPKMGDLPAFRVQGGRPFQHVGCDFAGPFYMRDSLRRKASISKVYLCLFVCMQTKALHLEPVTQLSTDAFMAALDRFTSRRGLPSDMYSDSGTNFVGAANLLKDIYFWLNKPETKQKILHHSLEKEIKWHFNPPLAPHFGGIWESGVRSVKRLMRTSIGDSPLTYEELATLFARYEAILNSRPLCPVSSDPEDTNALTPGHFLVGGNLLSHPEPSLLDLRENTLDRWQLVKRTYQHFWSKWHMEYLTTLQKRVKWTKDHPNLQVGDLVLIKTSSLPVMQWPTARVHDVHPGPDGVVRVATVRTAAHKTFRRPVVQLIPLLPLNSST